MANATLEYKQETGSIHKTSARILNLSAYNGWDYWYVERDKELLSVNLLRKQYIDEYLNTEDNSSVGTNDFKTHDRY